MNYCRTFIVVALLLLGLGAIGAQAVDAGAAPVIIDTRTEAEWLTGHLEGAVLIHHERIDAEIGKAVPDRKTKIYVYCRTGRRSGIALETLKKLGYEDVTNLGSVKNAAKTLGRQIVK